MNWYHRGEGRYVEYGTSFKASQAFGFKQSLTDTIYNMNLEHLAADVPTVFERLDDADVRTAGTTYLMYRGRHRHEVSGDTALTRIASTVFRHAVYGPREFFYADLFASRRTPCRSQLGLPGVRDQHAGCVGEYLVERDLFDFLLLSLPDNDTHSHKNGPMGQVESLSAADRQIERLFHAAGGADAFLEDHAVIVLSDHSQSRVDAEIDLFRGLADFAVLPATRSKARGTNAEIALCPNSRAAQVYVLDRDRRAKLVPRIERALLELEGVDLVMRMTDHPDGEAAVRSARGELRFTPRGGLQDERGQRWSIEGDASVLALQIRDDRVASATYPDALGRVWAALRTRTAGEVLASAKPGYEFQDWGGAHHVGGGSHGSLHANDSLGSLIWCGTGPDADARERWTLRDVLPMVTEHFGV
jgi:Type I phosphodiesterase / nucleotide pyrophosphatase